MVLQVVMEVQVVVVKAVFLEEEQLQELQTQVVGVEVEVVQEQRQGD